jgi:hypothetical protein
MVSTKEYKKLEKETTRSTESPEEPQADCG